MSKFKKYKIKKDCHRSGIYFKPFLKKDTMVYEVAFTKSCIYDFGDLDQFDINKLFGRSFGLNHHNDSVRFGWRAAGDKIEISSYYYKNKKRADSTMCQIEIDNIYTFEICTTKNSCIFNVKDDMGKLIKSVSTLRNGAPDYGYELFPYFGGNKTAPHDVEIFMSRIC